MSELDRWIDELDDEGKERAKRRLLGEDADEIESLPRPLQPQARLRSYYAENDPKAVAARRKGRTP